MGQFRSRTREGATAKTLNRKNERFIVGEGAITDAEYKQQPLPKNSAAYEHDLNRRANSTVNTDPRERSHGLTVLIEVDPRVKQYTRVPRRTPP